MSSPFEAIAYPSFRRFLGGRLLIIFGVQMMHVVISWMLYDLTKDPLTLGFAGLAELIPFFAVVWFSGALADRAGRKLLLALSSAFMAITLCLALFLYDFVKDSPSQTVYLCYGILVLVGIARGFFGPSGQAMVPGLVRKGHFPNATTWNSSVFHLASVSGPATGGILLGLGGLQLVWPILTLLTIAGTVLISTVSYSNPTASKSNEPFFQNMMKGYGFVRSNPVIIGSLSLDLFAVLFGGATALLPAFANAVLHCGPEGLGWLRAAPALGSLFTGIMLMIFPARNEIGKKLFFSVSLFGFATAGFALSEWLWLSWLLLFIAGAADNFSVIVRQTLVQLRTPEQMRGSVASINSIFIGMSNELGALESGLAARWLGLVPSVVAGGMAVQVVVLTLYLKNKALRTIRLDDH